MRLRRDVAVHAMVEPLDSVDIDALLARPAWHADAACRDVGLDVMFPSAVDSHGTKDRAVKEAEAICWTCPVRSECAEAGRNERHGVWGGRYRRPGLTDWRTPMLALLRHPHTAPQIADALDANIRNIYRRLRILTDDGHPIIATPQPNHRPTVYQLQEGT